MPISINDVKKFLSTDEHPLTMKEMSEFWTSLSDEEKDEYKRQVELINLMQQK